MSSHNRDRVLQLHTARTKLPGVLTAFHVVGEDDYLVHAPRDKGKHAMLIDAIDLVGHATACPGQPAEPAGPSFPPPLASKPVVSFVVTT
jgi:hypothetical protein